MSSARYIVLKSEWTLVSSPNSPLPRSSHQAVSVHIHGRDYMVCSAPTNQPITRGV